MTVLAALEPPEEMMIMRKVPEPSLTITFHWDTTGKRWLLRWLLPNVGGHGVSCHELWVERSDPIDALNARRLVEAARAEWESWLPW